MNDEPSQTFTEADAIAALLEREETDAPAEPETPDPDDAAPEADPEETADEEEPTDDAEVVEEASEDEAEEPEAPQEPQHFVVKVDGKEQRVTLEELTRSYSGQASIQRRLQEAETHRKEVMAAEQAFQREWQNVQALAQLAQQGGLLPPPKQPDPRLAQQDPSAYVKALAAFQSQSAAYQQQQAQLAHAQDTAARLQQARHQDALREPAQRLTELIPEFANPETAAKTRDRLLKAGQDYGFTAEELEGISDARMVAVLHKAAKFDELQARQREAKRPTPTPPPRSVAPAPPSKPLSAPDKARLSFNKAPTVENAVRLLLGGQS